MNSAWWRVAVKRMVSWSTGTTLRSRCSSAAALSSTLQGTWTQAGAHGGTGGGTGARQQELKLVSMEE